MQVVPTSPMMPKSFSVSRVAESTADGRGANVTGIILIDCRFCECWLVDARADLVFALGAPSTV